MAVSQMKKLSVAAPLCESDKLIAALQRMSCVEISKMPDNVIEEAGVSTAVTTDISTAIEADLACAKKAVAFLMEYDQGKKSLAIDPPVVSMENFDSGLDVIILREAKKSLRLSDSITKQKGEITDITAKLEALHPWLEVQLEIPQYKTEKSISIGGSIPASTEIDALSQKLSDFACVFSIIDESKYTKTVYITSHKDDAAEVMRLLSSYGFTRCTVTATEEEGYAAGVSRRTKEQLEAAKQKLITLKKDAVKLSENLSDIKALCDVYEARRDLTQAKKLTTHTEKTAIFTGWVPARAEKKVTELLLSKGCAYSFDDPGEDDDVPVLLNNNKFASNFEPILTMYALPVYGRFDPTMIMSVFYVIIFGLMFADAGYGLLLLIGSLAALKLLKPKESMKRFLTMFAICAVSSIIGGILFGGYFGDLPVSIMENFAGKENVASPALLFDMIEDPMMFLVLSLIVGAVHITTALIVKFVILARDGLWFDAVADVGSWLILFAGIGLYFINSTIGLALIAVGVLMLVGTQGRQEKNIILRFAKGVLSLYDIVSYASDLLSYSRILALSLASAVIASVVNLLATMGGLKIPGLILFVFVFLFGHTINFAVNILGTYVHTSRLQYIEFFGKFFEPGGKEFAPLSYKTKYVNFK